MTPIHPPEMCAYCMAEQQREHDRRPWTVIFLNGPYPGRVETFSHIGKQAVTWDGTIYTYTIINDADHVVVAEVPTRNTPEPRFVTAP